MKEILKYIYGVIPLKKQLFSFLKLFFTPSQNIYQHLHFHGPFTVQIDEESSFKIHHYGYLIENEIFWNGLSEGWEKHSMKIWIQLCKNANVIFDIGANTGVYALVAKATRPNAKVFAFEPVERVFKKLEKNVELNNFDITCVKKAISNSTGAAIVHDTDTEHTLSVTVNKNISFHPENTFEVEIETITLDDFIEKEKIAQADLIKIDVETHEAEALEGFKKYLHQYKPDMLIEILYDEIAIGIENIIADLGYTYFYIDENTGLKKVEKLKRREFYNYLICNKETADYVQELHSTK